MVIEVSDIVEDQGSVVIFDGVLVVTDDVEGVVVTDEGYRFAVDHRPAQAIVDAFRDGEYWPMVEVEEYQILGRI